MGRLVWAQFDWYPVVVYECESWTIKKAECRRTDAFKAWCWRILLRVAWTARLNKSILKEINPEYSLEGQMLKLKLQYFGHLMQRTDSPEKTLMLGKIEGKGEQGGRGWNSWMGLPILLTWVDQTLGDRNGHGSLVFCSSWESQRVRHNLETEQQGYSEEGISLWFERFRKVLEIGVVYEWPLKICVESESVQMREIAVYMNREGGSIKRKKGKVWEDRLENKGGGIQWNWIKTFWGTDEAFCLLWRISQQNMHFLLFIYETVSVHRVSKQEMTLVTFPQYPSQSDNFKNNFQLLHCFSVLFQLFIFLLKYCHQ